MWRDEPQCQNLKLQMDCLSLLNSVHCSSLSRIQKTFKNPLHPVVTCVNI